MADPTISHGWVTSEPDAGKDVDADNLNDHQITGFGAAVSAIVDPAVATEAAARATADTAAIAAAASDATTKVAAEAVLARNADNLASGTVADARIAATIARDSEVTSAVAAEATLARNADNLTSGTVADARIASTIARDSEVTSAVSAEATTRDAAIETHRADTTVVHGIADTANVVLTNDSRLTDSRAPSGAAGGDLGGTYPNPSVTDDSHSHTSATLPAAGADLSGIDYLVGTASALLSAEIVVGATPGGELGGTWASPTVDASHSGSTHAATQAAAEATAAADATSKANTAQAAAIAASQPVDATLTALAGLATGANKLPYSTGTDAFSQADFTAAARTVLDDASVSAMVDTLGGASATGTGGLVRATSPILVTPALGTPASGVATNLTGTAAGLNATPIAHVASHKAGGSDDLSGVQNGFAPLSSGLLVPIAYLPTGTGATQVALGNHSHAGTGVAVAPELVKKYTPNATNSTSAALTLTAHAAGHRMIVVVASYARDVNTPTCTNVTFTEIPAANFSTTIYLSFFVGIIAGGSSGTTLTITATGSNWIITDVYIVSDTLTPTAGIAATLTNTDASSQAGVAIGPIAPAIGSFYIIGAAQNDGTSGFAAITMNAGDAIGAKITPGGNSGLCSGIGRTCAANVYGYTTNGSSGGDFAAAIAIVS